MRDLIKIILKETTRQAHNRSNTEEFINKSKKIHGDLYDYSDVDYTTSTTPVLIRCKKHNYVFSQMPKKHLIGQGCPICAGNQKKTKEDFIKHAQRVHSNSDGSPKYQYNNIEFKNVNDKVFVTCPKHGDFDVLIGNHLYRNSGCPDCKHEKLGNINRYTQEDFINLSKKIHGNIYDYSEVEYQGTKTTVNIICREHGVFPQKPSDHLAGSGCPFCHESSGEKIINEFLKNNKIKFYRQHKFSDCTNNMAPPKCVILKFDFFLPEYNTIIEYDGIQHYKPTFGQKSFEITQRNDIIKNNYLKEKNIRLLRIPYTIKARNLINFLKENLHL